jgi:hypothetical protein
MREQRDFAFIAMLTRVVSLPLPSLLLARRYLAASAVSETGKGKKTKKADAEADGEESHKYAHTVNLPRTEFSMRADAGVREPQMQQICCDSLFAWQRKSRPLATYPQFVMLDGPPFANGPLHVGHFLNKVLKDIINRYKLLQGFGVPYTPGWDCHGLPIEQKALELSQAAARRNKTATTNAALSPTDIRSMCERLATSAINVQRNTFRRWGVMGDWANAYQTMDKQYEATQLGVFGEMVARGLIYRQLKPVHWSPSSRTALAEAELEYKDDHISHAVHIAFDVAQVSADAQAAGVTLQRFPSLKALIWTTTPWTLPANVAICLNAEMQYSIVSVTRDSVKSFLIIASDLVEARPPIIHLNRLAHFSLIFFRLLSRRYPKTWDLSSLSNCLLCRALYFWALNALIPLCRVLPIPAANDVPCCSVGLTSPRPPVQVLCTQHLATVTRIGWQFNRTISRCVQVRARLRRCPSSLQ